MFRPWLTLFLATYMLLTGSWGTTYLCMRADGSSCCLNAGRTSCSCCPRSNSHAPGSCCPHDSLADDETPCNREVDLACIPSLPDAPREDATSVTETGTGCVRRLLLDGAPFPTVRPMVWEIDVQWAGCESWPIEPFLAELLRTVPPGKWPQRPPLCASHALIVLATIVLRC